MPTMFRDVASATSVNKPPSPPLSVQQKSRFSWSGSASRPQLAAAGCCCLRPLWLRPPRLWWLFLWHCSEARKGFAVAAEGFSSAWRAHTGKGTIWHTDELHLTSQTLCRCSKASLCHFHHKGEYRSTAEVFGGIFVFFLFRLFHSV